MSESDMPVHSQHSSASRPMQWLRYAAEGAYYAAPEAVRHWVQTRAYAKLARRVQADAEGATEYPIDATGWLLIELVKALIKLAAGVLVRLERWPAPYHAAATLTHDIEPRRYAYTAGLDSLLDRVATTGHAATVGLVAQASERYLPETTVPQLRGHGLLCHGLTHRGDAVRGQLRVTRDLREARNRLQRQLHRPIVGYRSPRLDRSADLLWALDYEGFRFDSSYPDVDRENLRHYGGGVRLNIPFRPLLVDAPLRCRPSRCLELPLTAPDCIQPLFAGASRAQLRATVATKAAFVRDTHGLYVALVHAGVFGPRDAAEREAHLEYVHGQLTHSDVWLAAIEEIAEWWWAREALRVTAKNGVVQLVNTGQRVIDGVRVVVETTAGEKSFPVTSLAPGARTAVAVTGRAATVDDIPQSTAPRLRAVR
jgi:peptidoglycan/xylan/chitin deacetylase (PgdA/CDA1 family)